MTLDERIVITDETGSGRITLTREAFASGEVSRDNVATFARAVLAHASPARESVLLDGDTPVEEALTKT